MTSPLYIDPAKALTRADLDDRICMHCKDGPRTWREFLTAVEGWRLAVLKSKAVRVAVFSPDLYEMAAALYGAWAANATVLFPANTSEAMVRLLSEGAADALIGQFDQTHGVPVLSPEAASCPCRMPIDDQLMCELYTSGSTGVPVGIPKKIRKLFYEVENIDGGKYGLPDEIPQDAVVLSSVSAQHIYGLLFYLLWSLAAARAPWAERLANPEAIVAAARRHERVLWIASPALLKRLPDYLPWNEVHGKFSRIYSGGGPIDSESIARIARLTGIAPVEVLGSSETGGIGCRCRQPDAAGHVPDEPWTPLPSMTIKTIEGVLWVKSPQLDTDGWACTGDRADILEDGRFVHLGRADRVAKIAEKRVSLTGMEAVLVSSGLALKARAFQMNDARGTLAMLAVLSGKGLDRLLQNGKKSLVEDMKAVLLGSVERVCLPRLWRFVHAFPEDHMGKTTLDVLMPLFDPRAPQWILLEKTDAAARGILCVAANAPFFDGHFDEFAILPGLAQTQWVITIACHTFRIDPARFAGIRTLKFLRPVRPGETVILEFDASADSAVAFRIKTAAAEPCASGRILFSGDS